MRCLTVIFFLAVALANSARAQTSPFTVEIDLTSPVSGNLNFNPTALGSPYPFRTLPTSPLQTPTLGTQCFTLNLSGAPQPVQGVKPTPDGNSTEAVDPACFKSFPQFFKPLESRALNENTYVLQICNKQASPSSFKLTVDFTTPVNALNIPNPDFTVSRFTYRLDTGNWQSAAGSNVLVGASAPVPGLPATLLGGNCATVNVQLRLRLDGLESFLSSSLSSNVTFSVAVAP